MRESITVSAAQIAADELLLLLPALPTALRKDTTISGGGKRTFSSSLPLNQDVLQCAFSLSRDMRVAESRIRKHLGYSQIPDQAIEQIAASWPVYVQALDNLKDRAAMKAIRDLNDWLKRTRKAIGLSVPAQPLGQFKCPACSTYDKNPARLLVLGSEGTLVKRAQAWQVDWKHAEAIWCPACKSSWPREQWPLLGRMLNCTTDARTADTTAIASMVNVPSVTVRRWATEGRIVAVDHDKRGWPLYDVDAAIQVARSLGRIAEDVAA